MCLQQLGLTHPAALVRAQAPSNALVLWSVPPRLRPFAMALVVILIHLLGDVPSSPAIGWLQDSIQNWRRAPRPRGCPFCALACACYICGKICHCRAVLRGILPGAGVLGTGLNSTASSRYGMRLASHPLGGLPPSPAAAWLQDLRRNWGSTC